MEINNKFNFGDVLYLKTDKEQLPRMLVRISVRPCGLLYCLSHISTETWHEDFECSLERDIILATTN